MKNYQYALLISIGLGFGLMFQMINKKSTVKHIFVNYMDTSIYIVGCKQKIFKVISKSPGLLQLL